MSGELFHVLYTFLIQSFIRIFFFKFEKKVSGKFCTYRVSLDLHVSNILILVLLSCFFLSSLKWPLFVFFVKCCSSYRGIVSALLHRYSFLTTVDVSMIDDGFMNGCWRLTFSWLCMLFYYIHSTAALFGIYRQCYIFETDCTACLSGVEKGDGMLI